MLYKYIKIIIYEMHHIKITFSPYSYIRVTYIKLWWTLELIVIYFYWKRKLNCQIFMLLRLKFDYELNFL